MERSRATRLGRAGLFLPMLLVVACALVPDLGTKSAPAAASVTLAQLKSHPFSLDVQLVRSPDGGLRAA